MNRPIPPWAGAPVLTGYIMELDKPVPEGWVLVREIGDVKVVQPDPKHPKFFEIVKELCKACVYYHQLDMAHWVMPELMQGFAAATVGCNGVCEACEHNSIEPCDKTVS